MYFKNKWQTTYDYDTREMVEKWREHKVKIHAVVGDTASFQHVDFLGVICSRPYKYAHHEFGNVNQIKKLNKKFFQKNRKETKRLVEKWRWSAESKIQETRTISTSKTSPASPSTSTTKKRFFFVFFFCFCEVFGIHDRFDLN